jgi:cobalamin biosynthesis protein CobT
MGIIHDVIYDDIDNIDIVTEAEDITNQLDDDVDDILGTKANKDKDSDDSTEDDQIDDNKNDDNGTDQPSDNESNSDDPLSSDDSIQSDNSSNDASDPDFEKKKGLYEQMSYLYDILESNVDSLSNYIPPVLSNEVISIINNIKTNLNTCKNILYKVMTEEFSATSYPNLLKKFIGINRVYDICLKMLDMFFKAQGGPELKRPDNKK